MGLDNFVLFGMVHGVLIASGTPLGTGKPGEDTRLSAGIVP